MIHLFVFKIPTEEINQVKPTKSDIRTSSTPTPKPTVKQTPKPAVKPPKPAVKPPKPEVKPTPKPAVKPPKPAVKPPTSVGKPSKPSVKCVKDKLSFCQWLIPKCSTSEKTRRDCCVSCGRKHG